MPYLLMNIILVQKKIPTSTDRVQFNYVIFREGRHLWKLFLQLGSIVFSAF